jgi:hypothetical protein
MSLKIKKLTGEIFDLPSGYIIEAEKNNPLFTDKGSKTVPIHFPDTDNNRRLLLNSDRMDRLKRPDETFQVAVETDSSQQSGIMVIGAPFNAGIGFDEAEMYSQMKTVQLRDMQGLPKIDPPGNSPDEKITALLDHLSQVMKEQVSADYFVFTVVLNYEFPGRKYFDIINDVSLNSGGGYVELKAIESRQIIRYIDGGEIAFQVPKGYGVSPFIKVWRVLELLFECFGFTVRENPFREHRQLKKLVVLNNTMDAILTGTLHYRDMMPDITVRQFLDGLFNKFGMLYFLDSNSKTVQIKLLKDVITPLKTGYIDLSKFKTEEPVPSCSSAKQLKLLMNRQLEGCEVLTNTYEEFLNKYIAFADDDRPYPAGTTSFFRTRRSRYAITNPIQPKVLESSDFFDYDKKDKLEYEEIKMDDLCLPFPVRTPNELMYLYYGVKLKHLYTDIVVGNTKQGEAENPALLAFAFGFGIYDDDSGSKYFFASQINRDPAGNFINDENGVKYDLSLTCNREDGLFNRFWKEYDAFLRHSNFEVKCSLKLSVADIFKLDMFKTAIINGQPLLPKQIKYKLNQKDSLSECSFQTLRLYEPCNLAEEQKIPTYAIQKYYWKWSQEDDPDPVYLHDVKGYDILGYSYGIFPDKVEINGELIPSASFFLYPPTDRQYENKETVTFQYTWLARNPDAHPFEVTGTSAVTLKPELLA